MTDTTDTHTTDTDSPDAVTSERGRATRGRILKAALSAFARDGFEKATTRNIADDADAALPAIHYYFDNKEGLYLACAHEIVARYREGVGEFVRSVAADLHDGCTPDLARAHLKAVMRRVSMVAETTGTETATAFVVREMSEQGPAFDVLYRELFQPGVELTAALIAQVRGLAEPDDDARLRALMLHASLSAFTVTMPVTQRFLAEGAEHVVDHDTVAHDRRAATYALIDDQIDRLDGPTS